MTDLTDLTDRMRTCAAFLISCDLLGDLELRHDMAEHAAVKNAADLLIEASNIIEAAQLGTVVVDDETARALGLPMEVIPPIVPYDPKLDAGCTWIAPGPQPEPMEIIEPIVAQKYAEFRDNLAKAKASPDGTWVGSGDTLVSNPYRSPRACPKCDSRAAKRVHRDGKRLMITCPACLHKWTYNKRTP